MNLEGVEREGKPAATPMKNVARTPMPQGAESQQKT